MTPRRKRLFVVLGILGGVAASVALAVMASRENIMFYYDPSQVAAGQAPLPKRFRIGGMVVKGSVERKPGDLTGALRADRFRPRGAGRIHRRVARSVSRGAGHHRARHHESDGAFVADEVLAKHDEKYMPPEVAASFKQKSASAAPAGARARRRTDGLEELVNGRRTRHIRADPRLHAERVAGFFRPWPAPGAATRRGWRGAPGGDRAVRVRGDGVRLSGVLPS